jgi:drug/metabolite transporter, DME family
MPRLQVLLAAVCFGTTGTAQALGPALGPAVVGAARIAIGAALLALVAIVVARRRSKPLRIDGGRGTLLLAGACVAAYQVTFFAAVADTGVAVGTVVAIGSAPAFTGLFDRLSGGDPLGRRWAAATTLACAGVALLMLGGAGGAQIAPAGVALAALAGAGYAAYAVASKRLLDAGNAPETVMAGLFGTGALLVSPLLVVLPASELVTPGGAALALYLGLIPTAVAYVLFAHGLRRIPASETATLTLAEPLTAALLGVAVLGERPGPLAVAGATLVLAGLFLIAARPARAGGTIAEDVADPALALAAERASARSSGAPRPARALVGVGR